VAIYATQRHTAAQAPNSRRSTVGRTTNECGETVAVIHRERRHQPRRPDKRNRPDSWPGGERKVGLNRDGTL
jgi:hypothetical protein